MNDRIKFTEMEIRQLKSTPQKMAYRMYAEGKTPPEMLEAFCKVFPHFGAMERNKAIDRIRRHLKAAQVNLLDILNRSLGR